MRKGGGGDTPLGLVLRPLAASLLAAYLTLSLACEPALAAQHRHTVVTRPAAKPHKAEKFAPTGPAVPDVPKPFGIHDAGLEPLEWGLLDGWAADDHAAAFATFLVSCRPIAGTAHPPGENRPMYAALHAVCRRALVAGTLGEDAARKFFEDNFRPARIAKLGDAAGFLTGYYEPIVDGSRFPTPIYHVPIYRRPSDLLPPAGTPSGTGFPNTGQSLRRDSSGKLVPYYDRAQIEDGVLDGRHLELCWIKDKTDALFIQIQGSARIRLEDGLILRINYDSHNGYPYTPIGRILIDRKLVTRDEMSMDRIRQWIRDNPDGAEELRRQNRNFVFFRIVGLGDDEQPLGAQGLPLTPGRSIAVDKVLHVYGTPFFIQADLPIDSVTVKNPFRRLMIAQDTGSAIVGPARADIYWGSGKQAGLVAGRLKDHGQFTMLIPREIDPAVAGSKMPLPLPRPVDLIARQAQPKLAPPGRTAERGVAPTSPPLPTPAPKSKPKP
ncbi:MAG TPA: MltA domain-containing protein [Xanthobacteraceae bacterium]|jgi:membrane-bound lytic murein transglycosylase A